MLARRMQGWVISACLFAGLVLVYAYIGPGGTGRSADPPAARTTVAIERVVDGDTLVVSGFGAERETVRLIGVDTPETVHPDRPVQCYGPEASAYTKRLLPRGSSAILAFDAGTTSVRDRYGRLLAYVWKHDRTMVNLALVRGGYARAVHYPPQDDYRGLFKTAELEARTPGKDGKVKGRWGACPKS